MYVKFISIDYCKTLFLAASFFIENLLNFNSADIPVTYQITAVTLMVMGNSKSSLVFNFAIILELRKFDAGEIYVYYISLSVVLVMFGCNLFCR